MTRHPRTIWFHTGPKFCLRQRLSVVDVGVAGVWAHHRFGRATPAVALQQPLSLFQITATATVAVRWPLTGATQAALWSDTVS